MTDDELSRLVAERVCGWHYDAGSDKQGVGSASWVNEKGQVQTLASRWSPATDLNDAVRALDEGDIDFSLSVQQDAHVARAAKLGEPLTPGEDGLGHGRKAQALARALCLVVLQAKGVEVEP